MIRTLLVVLLLVLLYQALKTIVRAAIRTSRDDEGGGRPRIQGEEMVRDPHCLTYVPRSRAVTRTVGGERFFFCSDGCAQQYADRHRS